jgi:hypothetical protein
MNLMTIVCICWLKLQKPNYNARNGKHKMIGLKSFVAPILVRAARLTGTVLGIRLVGAFPNKVPVSGVASSFYIP